MVTGVHGAGAKRSDSWGSVSEETGLHAEPHLLSGSVLGAGGAHHLSLFIACLSLRSTPTRPASPGARSFSHLLPLLYRLIKTLLNPAALSSLRFRSSRDTVRDQLCICIWCFSPSCASVCVCVCGFLIPLSVWIYLISAYLGRGCWCFSCTSTVSQQFMSLWSMLANLCTASLLISLRRSGLFLLPCSRRYGVAL